MVIGLKECAECQ